MRVKCERTRLGWVKHIHPSLLRSRTHVDEVEGPGLICSGQPADSTGFLRGPPGKRAFSLVDAIKDPGKRILAQRSSSSEAAGAG